MRFSPSVVFLGALACVLGCGPSDEACAEVEDAAAQHVLDVVDADQPCVLDEDCEVVEVVGTCFDVCSRVIASSNHDAFEAALSEANDDLCADYDGCTLIAPPCDAPAGAVCGTGGQCQ